VPLAWDAGTWLGVQRYSGGQNRTRQADARHLHLCEESISTYARLLSETHSRHLYESTVALEKRHNARFVLVPSSMHSERKCTAGRSSSQ